MFYEEIANILNRIVSFMLFAFPFRSVHDRIGDEWKDQTGAKEEVTLKSVHDRIGDEWKDQTGAKEEVTVKCYGEFGDVHVVLLICGDAPAVEGEERVDGVDFHYNYDAFRLTVWQAEKFYSLQEGFERGILTHENLVTVRENHKAEYDFMYEQP